MATVTATGSQRGTIDWRYFCISMYIQKVLKDHIHTHTHTLTIRGIQFGREKKSLECDWAYARAQHTSTHHWIRDTDDGYEPRSRVMTKIFACILNPSTTATHRTRLLSFLLIHSRWSVWLLLLAIRSICNTFRWLILSSHFNVKKTQSPINPKRFDKFNELGYLRLKCFFFLKKKMPDMSRMKFQ